MRHLFTPLLTALVVNLLLPNMGQSQTVMAAGDSVELSVLPRHTSGRVVRTLVGTVAGAGIGAMTGYFITKDQCRSCDDGAPIFLGTAIGAVAGGVLGAVIVTQSDMQAPIGSRRHMSTSRHLVIRWARRF